jgi:hypothetical protein
VQDVKKILPKVRDLAWFGKYNRNSTSGVRTWIFRVTKTVPAVGPWPEFTSSQLALTWSIQMSLFLYLSTRCLP